MIDGKQPAIRRHERGGTPSAQRERAAATRAALVAAARHMFGTQGFHRTGTTELVARAGVTRGALYHHFADKEALFEAVFREVATELNDQTEAAVAPLGGDLWGKVSGAFRRYLELVSASREYQLILLIDAPAVLGWTRWRDLQSEYVARGTADALDLLMAANLVPRQPAQPLANLIQAALNDAALAIAHAPGVSRDPGEAAGAFLFLLDGLKARQGSGMER